MTGFHPDALVRLAALGPLHWEDTPCVDHGKAGNRRGYAQRQREGKLHYMHRMAYADAHGLSLEGLGVVMHKCDNPRCINPDHLKLGTYQDNSTDMVQKKRQANGERHGNATLTDEQITWVRSVYRPRHPEYGGAALAKALGVRQGTISNIITGRSRVSLTNTNH